MQFMFLLCSTNRSWCYFTIRNWCFTCFTEWRMYFNSEGT